MKLATLLAQLVLPMLVTGVMSLVLAPPSAGQPAPSQPPPIPPWKRQLTGEAAALVHKLEQQISQLQKEGKIAEAIEPARKRAEIRTRLQGGDHWQAADA